jgi:hypothetical protein
MMDKRTAEILKRFDESWSATEHFYDKLIGNFTGFERLIPVRQFIQTLRQNGANKFFRLGTALHLLVISRSVDHGLRKDQKHIKIEAYDDKFEVMLLDGEKIYRQYVVDSLSDTRVTRLLETLKSTLVD